MSTGVWNPSDIPSQNGRNIIITGATSGIGLETARELAREGANITLAARNPEKAKAVIQELEKETGNKNIEFMSVDTSSLYCQVFSLEISGFFLHYTSNK